MSDPKQDTLEANVARIQARCDVYWKVYNTPHKKLTPKQAKNLAINLDSLAKAQRALKEYLESYHAPEVVAVKLSDSPISNNHIPFTNTYGCPPDFDKEAFEGKYGFTIDEAFSRVTTGLLRPDLNRWQKLVTSSAGTFTQENADSMKRAEVTKQQVLLDFFAGKIPFSQIAGYYGGWYGELGCCDNLETAITDLGAAFAAKWLG